MRRCGRFCVVGGLRRRRTRSSRAALRLARTHARREPPLLHCRRRKEDARPHARAWPQRIPLAPHRRRGMENPVGPLSRADRDWFDTQGEHEAHDYDGARCRRRRLRPVLLHEGPDPRSRPLCRRARHPRRSGDRVPRAFRRRSPLAFGTWLQGALELRRILPWEGVDLRVFPERHRRGVRAIPGRGYPCRRRRMHRHELEEVRRLPVANEGEQSCRRPRPAGLGDEEGRAVHREEGPPHDGLGRTRLVGRPSSQRHHPELPRRVLRRRSREEGLRRSNEPRYVLLPRLCAGARRRSGGIPAVRRSPGCREDRALRPVRGRAGGISRT